MSLAAHLRLDHELLAVEGDHRVSCMLDLTAPPAPKDSGRRPLHLALVIDRSGSMAGAKLDVAKRCAVLLARKLRADDHLAVIAYDDNVALVHPLTAVGDDRSLLEHAIMQIFAGGSTNLSGGWLKATEQLRSIPGGTGPKKVLLLSDGQANQGIVDATELAAMAAVAADDGIGTTTIGFGDGFDEDLMTAMADAGGGNAYFAANVDEAAGIFAQDVPVLVNLVSADEAAAVAPDAEVVEEIVILKSARAQREARELGMDGRFGEAQTLLRATANDLRAIAPSSARAAELLEQADEIDGYGDVMDLGTFGAMQAKHMRYSSWQKQRGRTRRPDPSQTP